MSNVADSSLPKTQQAWRKALNDLPSTPEKIPAFFFGHGSPSLAFPEDTQSSSPMIKVHGPKGPLATFLKDFGPALLDKYKPKAIVVFSAHWESQGERLVTDYGDLNPLLMDYYGFPPELYQLQFKSRGDTQLAKRIVQLYTEAGQLARTSPKSETRGTDGRGFAGPGLDHGVFVPFRLMFGEDFMDIPVIEVSIDGSLSPEKNWAVGSVVEQLRHEGILILSGGFLVHNLRDMSAFFEDLASSVVKDFNSAILDAVTLPDPTTRKSEMIKLTQHKGFRAAHPREEHFVPLYVAAGAGGDGDVKVVSAIFGAPTFAFGI